MRRFLTVLALSLGAAVLGGCAAPAGPPPAPAATTDDRTPPVSSPSPGAVTSTKDATDPWLITTDGIGPYRLGVRVDSLPAGIVTDLSPVDSSACPELYSAQATGMYAGVLLLVVRHNYLVEISSGGGSPGVHTAAGDRVGTAWATVEGHHGTGTWRTNSAGQRAFTVPAADRVLMFHINPIRPDGVGGIVVGLADHSQDTFLSGRHC